VKPSTDAMEKWPGTAGKPVSNGVGDMGIVIGGPLGTVPVKVIVPLVTKKVIGPPLPGITVQPVISALKWSAPPEPWLVGPVRWPQPVSVASPRPPLSNSTQPQRPPSCGCPVAGSIQKSGLLQLKETPSCHSAVFP